MLILTRRMGESIIIGDGDKKVVVTVLNVKGSQVRLGIEAPKDVSVHREEIWEKNQPNLAISKQSKQHNANIIIVSEDSEEEQGKP